MLRTKNNQTEKKDENIMEFFYYRTIEGNWFKSLKEIPEDSFIIKGMENSRCRCPFHCRVENTVITNDSVKFQCGATLSKNIFTITYPSDKLNSIEERICDLQYEINTASMHRDDVQYLNKISSLNIEKEKLTIEYNNEFNLINYDSEGVYRDIFSIRIFWNIDRMRGLIEINYFDKNHYEENLETESVKHIQLKRTQISFDLKNGHTFFTSSLLSKNYEIINLASKVIIPLIVRNDFFSILSNEIERLKNRPISFNSHFDSIILFVAMTAFPFEPNLYFIFSTINKYINLNFDKNSIRMDMNCFNRTCSLLNLNSNKIIRKYFYSEPFSIYYLSSLSFFGFKDFNILSQIMDERLTYLNENNITTLSIHKELCNGSSLPFIVFLTRSEYLKAFCNYSIPLRGEMATWKCLQREKDSSFIPYDCARMFIQSLDNLSEKEKRKIMKDGFTGRNHDKLLENLKRLKYENTIYEYSDKQLSFETEIDGYTFKLPKTTDELLQLGSKMSNCVGSFNIDIINKNCTIVYALNQNNEYDICIEVSGNFEQINQCFGPKNSVLNRKQLNIFLKWLDMNNLTYTENKVHAGNDDFLIEIDNLFEL